MKQYLIHSGVMALILSLAACSASKPEPRPTALEATTVSTAQGHLIGFEAANGAHVWRGVHYAADTSGENRWRAPRPAPKWNGVKEALDFGSVCPQIATPFTPIESFTNGELEGSEDCLTVDIYAPADSQGKQLPVMVWIHGGGNVSGAAQLYIGENLAVNEDVVVISVQYRLGPLGWFSHPALVDSATTPEDKTANFGTLDLVAALKWVQENAASFGGNPNNVTIFGESAGGHNVATLLAAPLAEGLFHRAILQSGSFDSITIDEARGNSGELRNTSSDVTKRLGGADKFHTASLAEVFAAYDLDGGGFMEVPRIIQDGVVLPETPMRDAFSSLESFTHVPTISGTNKDEMKLFQFSDDRFSKSKFGPIRVAIDQNFYDAASDYSSRVWRIRSVDGPLARMSAAGHTDVYGYRFDWDEGGKFLWMDFSKMFGAAHAVEIPFVLNRFNFFGDGDKYLFHKKTEGSRQTLSRAMGAYWANFARDGKPTAKDLPAWPSFGEGAKLMYLDSSNDAGIRVQAGADNFEAIARDLKADARLTAAQRCEIAVGLEEWMPELAIIAASFEGCE